VRPCRCSHHVYLALLESCIAIRVESIRRSAAKNDTHPFG
jgi:hypothetical protein